MGRGLFLRDPEVGGFHWRRQLLDFLQAVVGSLNLLQNNRE